MQYFETSFIKSISLLAALSIFLLAVPFAYTQAADLSLTPSTGSYGVGQTFTVTVRAVPNGDNVNAVEASLKFDQIGRASCRERVSSKV